MIVPPELERHVEEHSTPDEPLLAELAAETRGVARVAADAEHGRLRRQLRGGAAAPVGTGRDRRGQHAARRQRRRPGRDGETTEAIRRFNEHVRADERTDAVILNVRDGMTFGTRGA